MVRSTICGACAPLGVEYERGVSPLSSMGGPPENFEFERANGGLSCNPRHYCVRSFPTMNTYLLPTGSHVQYFSSVMHQPRVCLVY